MPSTLADKLAKILKRLEISRSDQEAWKLLYNLLWPLVFATNYRFLRSDRGLAADASQEVFLRLYRYGRFDEFVDRPEEFRSYVRAVSRNVSRNYLSQILREPLLSHEQELEGAADFESAWHFKGENPESAAIRSNQISAFRSTLDDEGKQLLDLLLKGSTISEISQLLGLSYSNTAVRIHRLRLLARNRLTNKTLQNIQGL